MAIALDTSGTRSGTGTLSFTCTGTNLILVVGVFGNTGDGTVTGMTYNGVSLTQAIEQTLPVGTQYVRLYYLIAPTTGTNNLVVSGTDPSCNIVATSYTGVKQTGQPDATVGNTALASTTVSATLTTVANNCWAIAMVRSSAAGETNNSSAAATNRSNTNGHNYWDSNGALTPAGDKTLSYSSSASNWGLAGISVSPVVVTNSSFFNFMPN